MSTRNRMANADNRFQGEAKRVLCVCSAGLLRSPTLANVLHQHFGYNTRAVGYSKDYALIPLEDVHMDWAHEVVFVNQEVYDNADFLHDIGNNYRGRVVILDIPDVYEWNDQALRIHCLNQYMDHLEVKE